MKKHDSFIVFITLGGSLQQPFNGKYDAGSNTFIERIYQEITFTLFL